MADFVSIKKGLGPEGRIAVVRFDRGDGINALSPEALRQLTDAARSFEDDGNTSVVVLTGSDKAFSAGFDLKDPEGRNVLHAFAEVQQLDKAEVTDLLAAELPAYMIPQGFTAVAQLPLGINGKIDGNKLLHLQK